MTEKEQRAIISRLHRISGQVAGIEKMVSEGAPEEEIIIQINAVKPVSYTHLTTNAPSTMTSAKARYIGRSTRWRT